MTLFYLYIRLFSYFHRLIIIFIQCELEARADYIALYIHVTETGKGRIHTVCICILLSYQVCCFVTNVVKIISSSECLFLFPFCIVSAWERNGKRANSHRVYMYTFVLSESKRRVKPSADVRVVILSKKNTTQTTPVTRGAVYISRFKVQGSLLFVTYTIIQV